MTKNIITLLFKSTESQYFGQLSPQNSKKSLPKPNTKSTEKICCSTNVLSEKNDLNIKESSTAKA